jgi:amidase
MQAFSLTELQSQLASGELTSVQLVESYLEQIELIDRAGPTLNAIIELNPDAQEIAAGLDRERAEGRPRGPLHGIPIILKDNIDTADRMTTTAGSLALEGHIAARDAFLVERLRAAGALILAKANLSEWANFRSTRSVSGWSSRGGQTRNPYALDRSPCGSSSGSAVAVAANLCAAAVGTETDGSIICPAQTNGVVGIKPTLGLVSRSGVIPIAHSQDTAGPLARSVADAALLLGAMTGMDERDPATLESQGRAFADYTPFLRPDGLQGARLGVVRDWFGDHPQVDRLIEGHLALLKEQGAELVDLEKIEHFTKFGEGELEVLLYEFKADLNAYLAGLPPEARVHSLDELVAYNDLHAETIMPYFGQERMLKALEKGPLSEADYLKALADNQRLTRQDGIDALLREYNLEALVAPSGGPAWLVDYVNGDSSKGPDTTSPPAVSGYPHITVPAGQVYGLPVGLSFIGMAYSEPALLRLAYAFEQAAQARQAPLYLARVNMERYVGPIPSV